MLSLIRGPILAAFLLIDFVLITLAIAIFTTCIGVIKLLTPVKKWRNKIGQMMGYMVPVWMSCVNFLFRIGGLSWDIARNDTIEKNKTYLVISNHQSNLDIFILGKALGFDIGSYKFFIKREMLWIPFVGFACWAMDFPFMKRLSKEKLAQNPNLKGNDIETTIRCCERFRGNPTAVLNFAEGTRFRIEKHQKQQSPYMHLLKPKAGGAAFAMQAMGDQIDYIVDVSIAYPGGAKELWDVFCGRLKLAKVEVDLHAMPAEFVGKDYNNDPDFRSGVQNWIQQRWQEKDTRLERMLNS